MFSLDGACLVHSYAWLFVASGLVNWIVAAFLMRYGDRSRTIFWFRIFLLAAGMYFVAQAFAGCSVTDAAFQAWVGISQGSVIFISIAFFIFTLYFVGLEAVLGTSWMTLLLTAPSLGLLWLLWHTSLISVPQLSQSVLTFGFHYPAFGKLSAAAGLFYICWFAAAIMLLLRYWRRVDNPQKKREVQLVLLAVFITLVPSLITELLIWTILRGPHIIVAPFTAVAQDLIIFYALTRYGLHIFNLNAIADNILGVIPGGLIIIDHTDTIQYVNVRGAQALGYESNQLIGSSIEKILPGPTAYADFKTQVLDQVDTAKQPTAQETAFAGRTKTTLPVSVNAAGAYVDGQLTNRLIAFTDITSLKQVQAELMAEKENVEKKVVERTRKLNETEAELVASVSSLPFGFAIIGQFDQVVFANDRLSVMLNRVITGKAGENRAILQMIQAQFAPVLDTIACVHETRTSAKPMERNISLGTRYFRFMFIPVTREDAGRTVVISTALLVEDTTEEKVLQRSRDEFFSIASHELRTPLTVVRGNASMILQYFKDQLTDETVRAAVVDIHEASIRLIDIVNDFLDVSRLEQGRIEFKLAPVDLRDIVNKTLREYQVTDSSRKLYLKLEPPASDVPPALADGERVQEILINLISNGIKYTEQGGVTVRLETTNDKIRVLVTDTGKGIPQESQYLLFRKFQQASNNILTRDNTQSTGLGLYISRLLAQGMDGSLTLEWTELGKGSRFVLELPRAKQ